MARKAVTRDGLAIAQIPQATMAQVAAVADRLTIAHVFSEYRSLRAKNTLDRQESDLRAFKNYLFSIKTGIPDGIELHLQADAWRGINRSLVYGFVKWMANEGDSIGTINVRLSTIKTYVGLAADCDVVSRNTLNVIRSIHGYRHKEGLLLDARRKLTRIGDKKPTPVSLSSEQVETMRRRPSSTAGACDTLILDLLIELGLRCGEAASLSVENFDLAKGTLTFYRQKVDLTQIHSLTERLKTSLAIYLEIPGAPAAGPLLRLVTKDDEISRPLNNHALAKRIRAIGAEIGIPNLSPHDLRHYWATQAARNKTPLDRLQNAGGWKSFAMPLRYIEKTKVANEGVILRPDEEAPHA